MKTVGWLTGAMLITADPALGGSWVVIGDSLSAEYASVLDAFPIPGVDDPPVSRQAAAGALELHWAVDLARSRHVQVAPESSGDLRHWAPLPEGNVTENPDGRRIARLPLESGHGFLRLSVALVPVE
jgi:hypothetical protein